jgi:hypothetical protein
VHFKPKLITTRENLVQTTNINNNIRGWWEHFRNLDRHAWQYKSYCSITSWTVLRWQRHVKIHGGGKVHQLSPVVSNGICNAFSCSLLTTAKVSIEDGGKKLKKKKKGTWSTQEHYTFSYRTHWKRVNYALMVMMPIKNNFCYKHICFVTIK